MCKIEETRFNLLMKKLYEKDKRAANNKMRDEDKILYAEQFKDLKIDTDAFINKIAGNCNLIKPVKIHASDVIHVLDAYSQNEISFDRVIEWCDIVKTDLFELPDDEKEQEAVAVVTNQIATCEMPGFLIDITPEQIAQWRTILERG